MNSSNIATFIVTVEGVTTALFAVALTLVALVPPLADMSRARGSSYFATQNAKTALSNALKYLSLSLGIFALAMLIGGIGIVWPSGAIAIAIAVIDAAGLAIVVIAGARLSLMARDAL